MRVEGDSIIEEFNKKPAEYKNSKNLSSDLFQEYQFLNTMRDTLPSSNIEAIAEIVICRMRLSQQISDRMDTASEALFEYINNHNMYAHHKKDTGLANDLADVMNGINSEVQLLQELKTIIDNQIKSDNVIESKLMVDPKTKILNIKIDKEKRKPNTGFSNPK